MQTSRRAHDGQSFCAKSIWFFSVGLLVVLLASEVKSFRLHQEKNRNTNQLLEARRNQAHARDAVPCSCTFCAQGETISCLPHYKDAGRRTCVAKFDNSRVEFCTVPPGDVVLQTDAVTRASGFDEVLPSTVRISSFCLYECMPKNTADWVFDPVTHQAPKAQNCTAVSVQRVMQLSLANQGDTSFDIDLCNGDQYTYPVQNAGD